MTHDELLEEINKDIDQTPLVKDFYPVKTLFALRAVVELANTRPVVTFTPSDDFKFNYKFAMQSIIQAIEAEFA